MEVDEDEEVKEDDEEEERKEDDEKQLHLTAEPSAADGRSGDTDSEEEEDNGHLVETLRQLNQKRDLEQQQQLQQGEKATFRPSLINKTRHLG